MEISLPSHIIPLPRPTPPLITQCLTPVLVQLLLFIPKNVKKEQKSVYLFSFVETLGKFIIAELSFRKLGSSSVLIIP